MQKESFQKYQIIYYLPKLTCSLFLMKMKVGMAVILYSAATSSMSSTSTWHRSYTINQTDNEAVRLTKLQLQLLNFKMEKTLMKTTSSSVLFNSSRTGAIILHGPHLIKSHTIITALQWTKLLPGCKKVNNHQFLPSRGKLKSAQMKSASNSKAGECAPGSWSHQCQSQRGPSWLQWVQFCNSLYMMRGNSNPNIQFEKKTSILGGY